MGRGCIKSIRIVLNSHNNSSNLSLMTSEHTLWESGSRLELKHQEFKFKNKEEVSG